MSAGKASDQQVAGNHYKGLAIQPAEYWKAEADRWREVALLQDAQIETAIKRIQWRQDNLDRGIKELKGDY